MDHTETDGSDDTIAESFKQTLHLILIEIRCKSTDLATELKYQQRDQPSFTELKCELLKVLYKTKDSYREIQNYKD